MRFRKKKDFKETLKSKIFHITMKEHGINWLRNYGGKSRANFELFSLKIIYLKVKTG